MSSSNAPLNNHDAKKQAGNNTQMSSLIDNTLSASWEYLMPKRKERMAAYIRESDPTLADSTTIESQAKAVRVYGQKEGYIYEPQHEYKEAISAYTIPYLERPQLQKMLETVRRGLVDVVVVSEVRAISRRQVEVFVIYDILQKHGVRLETIKEKFEDDAMGRLILSLRAAYAEIEREQSYARMQRGKKDRIEISNAPNGHAKAAYGYVLVDTEKEVKGCYAFNHATIHIDSDGVSWSEYTVMLHIIDMLLKERQTLRGICRWLNDKGIPPPKKALKGEPHWTPSTLVRLLKHPILIGEAYANRWKKDGKKMILRPQEEWIPLPGIAPAMIDRQTFEAIQEQLRANQENSLRNNKHPDKLGLLRGPYIVCGVCGRRMQQVNPDPKTAQIGGSPRYRCQRKFHGSGAVELNHRTQIHTPLIDRVAWEKVIEVLKNPEMVRARIMQLREENTPVIDVSSIEGTLENIRRSMKNIYTLAEKATDDETMAQLTQRMNELEKQKREIEALLYDIADDEEERLALEAEIIRFEKWTDQVRDSLTDCSYVPTYEEKRLAIHILGLKVTVFPTNGDYDCRYKIEITVPTIMKKLSSVSIQPKLETLPW